MPKCKNDPKRSYKGDEPSPKGLGYCAHAEKIGMERKGRDGKMWIIKTTTKGIKRWIKKVEKKVIKGKSYMIHDNFERPFKVVIDGKDVYIYKEGDEEGNYDKLVKKYEVKKVYIGKSSGLAKGSDHKPNDAKKFEGNSILLQIGKNRYVYIGDGVYEFEMDDEVEKYYSLLGHSDVPYPVILGKKNVYFMLGGDQRYVDRKLFPKDMKNVDWEDAYAMYYGHIPGMNKLKDKSKKMKKVKMIHKRIW